MFNKKYFLGLLLSALSTIAISLPVFAGMERDLSEALAEKRYIFSGKLSDIQTVQDGKKWTFDMDGKEYFIEKGRPNEICPNGDCKSWKNFVAKLTTGINAKVNLDFASKLVLDDNDYTVFTKKAKHEKVKHSQKKESKKKEKTLTLAQTELLNAVKMADFITITNLLENKDTSKYRSKQLINGLLNCVWDKDYNIKMAVLYVIGLLSKDKKLDKYVYNVCGEACDEANYRYRTRPIFSGHCLSAIRQYGMYDVANGVRKGFVVATRMPGDDANAIYRRTMDEDFFIISGNGEFWTKDAEKETGPFKVAAGDFILNPKGMHIQFRNIGDSPLRMIVTTNPPYDTVVVKWPEDEHKEIHEVIGFWRFDKTYNEIAEKIKKLGLEDKNVVKGILEDKDAPLLDRCYSAKLFTNDFIDSKLKIANNPNENWALRVAVIESLYGNKSKPVIENLMALKDKTSGFVNKAILDFFK